MGGQMIFQAGAAGGSPRISVIMPALNEARNLPHVLSQVPENVHELILVDGHSVDDSVRIAREIRPDVHVVTQTRTGKGNALACGFTAATGDIIVTVDADGSADPGEIPLFVKALTEGADFAKGTRFAAGGRSDDITRLRRLGNRMLSAIVNLLYGTRYSDLCYGLNAMWDRVVPVLGLDGTAAAAADGSGCLRGDGFEIETLINIRAARAGLAITEVPSIEHARIHGVSNLNVLTDGLRVLRTILQERFNSGRPVRSSAATHSKADGDRGRYRRGGARGGGHDWSLPQRAGGSSSPGSCRRAVRRAAGRLPRPAARLNQAQALHS